MPRIELSFPSGQLVRMGYENGEMRLQLEVTEQLREWLHSNFRNVRLDGLENWSANMDWTRLEIDGVTFNLTVEEKEEVSNENDTHVPDELFEETL